MIFKRLKVLGIAFGLCSTACFAQDSLLYHVTAQTTNSHGDYTPLWLNANRFGMGDVDKNNGFLELGVLKPMRSDSLSKWGLAYGADIVGAYGSQASFYIQQAYVEGRWLKGHLLVGSKELPMELKNNELSSGSQTLGINARPVPQVRVSLPDYWHFANGWLGLKGHIAYGMLTDGNWQEDFTAQRRRYSKHVLYHSKAGYLKVGNEEKFPLTVEMGLEMVCLFGGDFYALLSDGTVKKYSQDKGLKAFLSAFYPKDNNAGTENYMDIGGNHVGSWLMRINYDAPTWKLSAYADHFFDDHSQMFLLDYDGYGTGDDWFVKTNHRYFHYPLKDILLGGELQLKRCRWMNSLLVEYLYTKYQSGSIFHDHTQNIPDHLGGRDDYYNHQWGNFHWGQVMGNPLYMSPVYNGDGSISTKNNRFVAWHFGMSGDPIEGLHYRLMATYQTGYGTYSTPYDNPKHSLYGLAELSYRFPKSGKLEGWSIGAGLGVDKGSLLGNNYGLQITIGKTGIIHF